MPAKSTKSRRSTANERVSTPRRSRTKDPCGGLTEAGRKAFAQKDGSHLKPGVKKAESQMTAQEMKRKGSWAVRFYGRKGVLPPLEKNGKPTRFALTAHAWGEPVPKTEAAARKIAAKGKHFLSAPKPSVLVSPKNESPR